MQQKRQTAFKVKIADILSGTYTKEEGWQPNYVILKNNLHVSRVNIIGTILSIQHDINFSTAAIDDGSGIMPIRSFEKDNLLKSLKVGDIVQVIGRPRQYGSEKYILLEICKKITNPAWIKLRALELKKLLPPKQSIKKPEPEQAEAEPIDSIKNKILKCIKKFDAGQGADYEEVVKEINNEQIIKDLLQKGEIFEIKPGKLKILE